MLIVPIKGDTITTKDGATFIVSEYSNFKAKGPCIYVEAPIVMIIYFFDVETINGVKVSFNNSSKVFEALGHIKRKIQLPQKHDTIVVSSGTDDEERILVDALKLHSKSIGLSRGLVVLDENKKWYLLSEIIDIDRAEGTDYFDKRKFSKAYKDYFGVKK